MAISKKLREIYASAVEDARYIESIELSHPSFSKTFYLTNDDYPWAFKDEKGGLHVHTPFPFQVTLPKSDTSGNQELQLVMANAGLEMMSELEAAQKNPSQQIQLKYRVYLDQDQCVPQMTAPITLDITNINATNETITATATRFNVLGRAFPTAYYTSERFPGLVR